MRIILHYVRFEGSPCPLRRPNHNRIKFTAVQGSFHSRATKWLFNFYYGRNTSYYYRKISPIKGLRTAEKMVKNVQWRDKNLTKKATLYHSQRSPWNGSITFMIEKKSSLMMWSWIILGEFFLWKWYLCNNVEPTVVLIPFWIISRCFSWYHDKRDNFPFFHRKFDGISAGGSQVIGDKPSGPFL